MKYANDLCRPYTKEIVDLQSWLEALQKLYHSANDESDHFHGLFLNNHNFTRRAYSLAKATSLGFSTAVLEVCCECRFSSLTMNSAQLNEFFKKIEGFHTQMFPKKSWHDHQLGIINESITHEEIRT
ncbi:MAG TPA: hypothetical protein PLD88_06975, partial [Candidatus Berkiella sp.]|nr:hypothetical protein [Candidatus Berkiella sp.]